MTRLHSIARSAMLGIPKEDISPVNDQIHLPDRDPEAKLLSAGAAAGIAEMAGQIPIWIDGTGSPCPPETRLRMPAIGVGLLLRILSGEFEAVLPEFLQLAAARGYVAPPEALPSLLGYKKKEIRPLILAVLGERGRWLGSLNPAWSYALNSDDLSTWETGTPEERVLLLEKLRAADPAKARQMVQATWEQDPPKAREMFLSAFAAGLSMQDEPFLESCLDDKRKEVRGTALELLVRLPGSRLIQRGAARLEPCLKLKTRLLARETIEVSLPEQLDAAAKRDGAGGPALRKGLGEKSNWLAQMLSVVPPAVWSEKWGLSPEKLCQAALNSEWKETILTGWRLAVDRSGDPEWALALAELIIRKEEARKILAEKGWGRIACFIPDEGLERLARTSIIPKSNDLHFNHPMLELLEGCVRPWSPDLSRMVIASIQRQARGYLSLLADALPRFGLYIPPELIDEFVLGWPEKSAGWDIWIDQFIAVLQFRREIMEVL